MTGMEGGRRITNGARVVLHGLKNQRELNGHFGLVTGPGKALGHYSVQLEDSSRLVSVSPANVTALAGSTVYGQEAEWQASRRGDCVVCLEAREASHAVVPCGHVVACGKCVKELQHGSPCPVCRVPISQFIQVFVAAGAEEARLEAAERRAAEAEAAREAAERALAETEEAARRAAAESAVAATWHEAEALLTPSALKKRPRQEPGETPEPQWEPREEPWQKCLRAWEEQNNLVIDIDD
eukprot:CAMPEP_0179038950 /NCGR_PEP_ID=MMETSP0796-20121207/14896_1 /TAXON_ID=73915 /ORGANISM="Pyrodinium bahamense, Strain pbaha01" /LENGTH=239 /DNA_ID=CAMNT_0020735281 /DNA_START=45 /DNA_END=764 /DNA_ORIENTATION=+